MPQNTGLRIQSRRQPRVRGAVDLPLSHRCVTFGVPRPGAGYKSYVQIFQARDHVAIGQKRIHDVRVIPLDGRPHVKFERSAMAWGPAWPLGRRHARGKNSFN